MVRKYRAGEKGTMQSKEKPRGGLHGVVEGPQGDLEMKIRTEGEAVRHDFQDAEGTFQ